MSIKNSTINSDLKNEESVKFEGQTNCKSKEWFFLCVLTLASVIKRKIFSHLADCGDEMQRVLRNQVICQRAEWFSEVHLHVLVCKLGGQRLHEKLFVQANHFVLLIQFHNQSRKEKEFYNTCSLNQKK